MSDDFTKRQPPSLGAVRPRSSHGHPPPPPPPRLPDAPDGEFRGPRTIYKKAGAPKRRGRWAGMLAYGALAMLALLLAGATLLIVAPPTDLIRDRLIAEVKARWGRDLSIKGGAELTFVPALGVRLKGVTLSAPAGMTGPPLIEADGLEVQVALLPLVSRNVSVERLVLRRPVIELRVDGQGRRSWDFAAAGSLPQPGLLRYAQVATRGADGQKLPAELQDFVKNASPANTAAKVKLGGAGGLSFGDVHVAEGTIKYADARKGVQHEVKGIDARLLAQGDQRPVGFQWPAGVGRRACRL